MHRANPQAAIDPSAGIFIIRSIFRTYVNLLTDFVHEAEKNSLSRAEQSTVIGAKLLRQLTAAIKLLEPAEDGTHPASNKERAELLSKQITSIHDVLEAFDLAIEQRTGVVLPKNNVESKEKDRQSIEPFVKQRAAMLWQLRALGSNLRNGSNLSLTDTKSAEALNEEMLKKAEAEQQKILETHSYFTHLFKRKNIKDILWQFKNPENSSIIKNGETSDYECVHQKLDALILSLDMSHFPNKVPGRDNHENGHENGKTVMRI